jgi:anthranilate synthase component 2
MLTNLSQVYHGVATSIEVLPEKTGGRYNDVFNGLPAKLEVGRYHSWVVDEKDFPDCLEITSRDEAGYIMSLQHKQYDVQGVQFHPESVLTPDGEIMMRNWLKQ